MRVRNYMQSYFYVTFFSSCHKGESSSEKNKQTLSQNQTDPVNKQKSLRNEYCTDLDDEKLNPLGKYQWHLKNTGQKSFATSSGVVGQDINVAKVLKEDCLSGKGIYVGVVDSGLDINHPSLKPNIDNRAGTSKTWSMNYRQNRLESHDPSPIPGDDPDHGTMVAGIIAMRSNLGFGGSGVAPRANLSGYNFLLSSQNSTLYYESLGLSQESKGNDIFNMSFGMGNISQSRRLGFNDLFRYGTRKLRSGKGAIYVKAAGNGFYKMGAPDPEYTTLFKKACETSLQLNVSCQDANMSSDNTLPEIIIVGALNAEGFKSSYSTTGSNLWVSAPGGEFGYDKYWIDEQFAHYKENKYDWSQKRPSAGEPAIITTDVSEPGYGMSRKIDLRNLNEVFSVRNPFNACLVKENNNCNYTNIMNGTSSATPVTAGSIALILEANPNLTWRDIKYILAKTSTKILPGFSGVKVALEKGEYQADQGWITNNAGFHFSNWFGFGRVNVGEAIKLAKNYDFETLDQYVELPWQSKRGVENMKDQDNITEKYLDNILVPKGEPNGIIDSISIDNENLKIESVRVRVTAESNYIGDLGLELTSPSGTKNIIWHIGNAFSFNGNLIDMPISSNAFYGEDSKGVWKIRAVNSGLHKADVKFKGWVIQITGSKNTI